MSNKAPNFHIGEVLLVLRFLRERDFNISGRELEELGEPHEVNQLTWLASRPGNPGYPAPYALLAVRPAGAQGGILEYCAPDDALEGAKVYAVLAVIEYPADEPPKVHFKGERFDRPHEVYVAEGASAGHRSEDDDLMAALRATSSPMVVVYTLAPEHMVGYPSVEDAVALARVLACVVNKDKEPASPPAPEADGGGGVAV